MGHEVTQQSDAGNSRIATATIPTLLHLDDLRHRGDDLPRWFLDEYADFSERLLDPRYPCHFGTKAEKNGELRYAWIETDDLHRLPYVLRAFLDLSRGRPLVRHALAVFFKPEPVNHPLDWYRQRFWAILDFLHQNDEEPWPRGTPTDPSDPTWEFCFDGEPMFVFASSPAYRMRASRNMGNSLVLLFQPRRVFRGIEGGTAAGTRAREVIRERMRAWDRMDFHPDMGSFGDPSSLSGNNIFSLTTTRQSRTDARSERRKERLSDDGG